MMQYGKITRLEEINVTKGIHSKPVVIYSQSIFVSNDLEPRTIFNGLMEDMRSGKLTNPGIQLEVYPDTGKIKRVVKSWTELK
ncbi:MAG TPA: hypothetical protein VJ836_00725 [Candidatus Saccharimonadales bacterium]|nr:hypothetical protein [Candidatus Saccharimonadales bacterium]